MNLSEARTGGVMDLGECHSANMTEGSLSLSYFQKIEGHSP